jgi:hypothetical protein
MLLVRAMMPVAPDIVPGVVAMMMLKVLHHGRQLIEATIRIAGVVRG